MIFFKFIFLMFVHLTNSGVGEIYQHNSTQKGGGVGGGGGGDNLLVFIVNVGPAKDLPLRKRSSVKLSCAFYWCHGVNHS